MSRRKKKKEEHENHERWLISYADFITLLFAFFTTMYAVSNVDAQKLGRMVLSMQAAFDATVFPTASQRLGIAPASMTGGDQSVLIDSVKAGVSEAVLKREKQSARKRSQQSLVDVKSRLEEVIHRNQLEGKVRLILDRRGLIIRLAEVGFYNSGSAVLKPESIAILDQLASQLANMRQSIRVEGHTDNVPINTSRYPTNWELSTARATNIVIYLQEHYAFDPQRLAASGYGEFRPLVPNNTAENRAMNRRVDIILLNDETAQEEPLKPTVDPAKDPAKDSVKDPAEPAPAAPAEVAAPAEIAAPGEATKAPE